MINIQKRNGIFSIVSKLQKILCHQTFKLQNLSTHIKKKCFKILMN